MSLTSARLLLGVHAYSTAAELKLAYHRALRRYHPDLQPTSTRGAEVHDAYDLLDAHQTASEFFPTVLPTRPSNCSWQPGPRHAETQPSALPHILNDVVSPTTITTLLAFESRLKSDSTQARATTTILMFVEEILNSSRPDPALAHRTLLALHQAYPSSKSLTKHLFLQIIDQHLNQPSSPHVEEKVESAHTSSIPPSARMRRAQAAYQKFVLV